MLSAGYGVLRDWAAEVNGRGRINVGGVLLPPHTAEGVAAQNVETFLGSLATVHNQSATTGEQALGWLNIGLTLVGGAVAIRSMANAGAAVNQADDAANLIGTLVNSRFAARGGAQVVRVGQAGEDAHDIGKKVKISVNGRFRIPDGITNYVLSEVKNVSSLSFTRQLRDFADFAQQTGRQFDLYVRRSTRLSGPL